MEEITYILHFSSPLEGYISPQYGDQSHYIGYSQQFETRIKTHLDGKGSRVTRRCLKSGIVITIGALIHGYYEKEAISIGGKYLCNICIKSRSIYVQGTVKHS